MKALLLENIHPAAVEVLERRGYEVDLRTRSMSEGELVASLTGVHLLGIRSNTTITPRVLEAFDTLGYQTDIPFAHWLGKIRSGDHFMDVIFSSGNAVARVDDLWFEHAPKVNVLGLIVRLTPVEEMIWSKAFIQERERYDGADVLHLLRETGPSLDWPRLLMRFGDHWRVLLSHLILFGFVYPDRRQNIPPWVNEELMRRLSVSRPNLQNDTCYGTLLSREQYLHDIEQWKYHDAREQPYGFMTREQVDVWTAAIKDKD